MTQTIATTAFDKRRLTEITKYIPDDVRRILDVGCVRHSRSRRAYGNLHAQLYVDYPDAEIVGIDMPSEETKRMQSPGYDIRAIDAQEMYLEGEFDAIIAGEVIEHLPSPGTFFKRASDHLSENGRIVVSTPNPGGVTYFAQAAVDNWTSEDHTCWIDAQQLGTILERSGSGLSIQNIEYVEPPGVVSSALYSLGRERIGAGTYVAVIE